MSWDPPPLDKETIAEMFGPDPDPGVIERLGHDVGAAVASLRFRFRSGGLRGGDPQLVAGLPLANWLSADALAALIREFG